MEVVRMSTYTRQKVRMYHFLTLYCDFQKETLDLLNYKNLKRLAQDYGYKGVRA